MGAIQIQRAFLSLFRLFQLNIGLSKPPRHVRNGLAIAALLLVLFTTHDGIAFFTLRQTQVVQGTR
jgi:predicted Kef-type K+ transport protein